MGDEEIGDLLDLLEIEQELQNAVGHQRVERRGHLVADDELGLGGQRAGDADPLLLAAREFGRIAVDEAGTHLDFLEQLLDAPVALGALQTEIEGQRSADDRTDGMARIHRDIGHLVDHLQLAQIVLAAIGQSIGEIAAVEDRPYPAAAEAGR